MNSSMEFELEEILKKRTTECMKEEWIESAQPSKMPMYNYRLDHTRHVVKIAKRIAISVGANLEVVTLAAWLHDISKPGFSDVPNHGEKSADIAAEILKHMGVSKEIVERVEDAIRKHVGLTLEKELVPIEAQVLWEADKIDKIGIVGFVRAVINGSRKKLNDESSITGIAKGTRNFGFESAKRIADSMYTQLGKEIAKERIQHLDELSQKFILEVSEHYGERFDE